MNEDEIKKKNSFWIGKKARLEILKDEKRLIFTADVIEMDGTQITFLDRDGAVFSFNLELVKEMQQLTGGD